MTDFAGQWGTPVYFNLFGLDEDDEKNPLPVIARMCRICLPRCQQLIDHAAAQHP